MNPGCLGRLVPGLGAHFFPRDDGTTMAEVLIRVRALLGEPAARIMRAVDSEIEAMGRDGMRRSALRLPVENVALDPIDLKRFAMVAEVLDPAAGSLPDQLTTETEPRQSKPHTICTLVNGRCAVCGDTE